MTQRIVREGGLNASSSFVDLNFFFFFFPLPLFGFCVILCLEPGFDELRQKA